MNKKDIQITIESPVKRFIWMRVTLNQKQNMTYTKYNKWNPTVIIQIWHPCGVDNMIVYPEWALSLNTSILKVMGTIARQLKALSQNTPQSSIIL